MTTSEDVARVRASPPGCFALIGNGEASPWRHNPGDDGHGAALTFGMGYHVPNARRRLSAGTASIDP